VATISKVHFEVIEQLNPNRVAKTEKQCLCNGLLLTIFRESRQALSDPVLNFIIQSRRCFHSAAGVGIRQAKGTSLLIERLNFNQIAGPGLRQPYTYSVQSSSEGPNSKTCNQT
jgi:hypothetical protein